MGSTGLDGFRFMPSICQNLLRRRSETLVSDLVPQRHQQTLCFQPCVHFVVRNGFRPSIVGVFTSESDWLNVDFTFSLIRDSFAAGVYLLDFMAHLFSFGDCTCLTLPPNEHSAKPSQ